MNTFSIKMYLVGVTALILIFAVDLSLPLGVAVAELYILVILMTLWSTKQNTTVCCVVACSVLTVLGYYFSPAGSDGWKVMVSRAGGLFTIWITAVLVMHWKAQNEKIAALQSQAIGELAHAERRNRAWIENSPVCTKILDLDFNLRYMSSAGVNALKVDDVTQLYGRPYPFDFYSDAFREQMTANLEKAKSTGKVVAQEAPVEDVEGDPLWFHSTIVPVNDEAGRLEYLMVVSLETTAAKLAEQALQRLSKVFTESSDIIVLSDRAGLIIEINPAAVQAYSRLREDMIGQPITLLVGRSQRSWQGELIAACLRGESVADVQWSTVTKAQVRRSFLIKLFPFTDEQDNIAGVVHVVRDISKTKALQREVLSIAHEEQCRIGRELHDGTQQELAGFGMLVQSMLVMLDGQGEKPLDESSQQELREIASQLASGLQLANRNITAMAHGLAAVEVESLGLSGALERLAANTRAGSLLSCVFKDCGSVEIADPAVANHLYRMAQEAVTNALKHGSPQQITITLRQVESLLELKIRNDGASIDRNEALQDGMGLHVMRYRADVIGARLDIGPIDGGGTSVRCTLSNRKAAGIEKSALSGL